MDNRAMKKTKFEQGNFIAWDGEGLESGRNLPQKYALLANSENQYIINPEGLSTLECLEFLTSERWPKNAIHCCFGASYDVNMMIKDLPKESLMQLHKGDVPVKYGKFELEYRPRKSFTIRKYSRGWHDKNSYERTVVLWDVLGFFQKKFVKVLSDWFKGTEHESLLHDTLHQISAGKERRGFFNYNELENFVLPYTLQECMCLRILMALLWKYAVDAGVVLSRWDGAGAAAAAFLKKYKVKEHIVDPPYEINLAGEYAYFGGWAEAFLYGIIDVEGYHYDIISAYPSAMPELPSLRMGSWRSVKFGRFLPLRDVPIQDYPSFWVGHIKWDNSPIFGPGGFQWRNKTGLVCRPPMGRGWIWSPEIEAVRDTMPDVNIMVDEIHYFVPNSNCMYPFMFIKDIFEIRKELKRLGIAAQIFHKLGPNSIYGKLAQSLGFNEERGIKPPYHSIVYAGLITSITRAKMLRACMQAPSEIIFCATDGIYSLVPLNLDIGTELGQWEYEKVDRMVVVQSGFYWKIVDGEEKYYYRGMNEGSLTMNQVVGSYQSNVDYIDIPTTRFMTLGASIYRKDFSVWRTWRTVDRRLDLNMRTSFKRKDSGIRRGDIRVSCARFDDLTFNSKKDMEDPTFWESSKYTFDWDGEFFDGQPEREVIEEMFSMELSPE